MAATPNEQRPARPARPATQYETLLIAEPSFEKEQADDFLKKFESTVQKHGGKLTKSNDWGKRKLAYEIKKHGEGYYLLIDFEGSGDLVRKVEGYLNLQSSVLRHCTVVKPKRKATTALPVPPVQG
jgi:small subunit ribosomal protein S6